MMHKLLVAFGLAMAVSLMPLAAVAHEGHDHGAKVKKVKKPKAKKGASIIVPQHLTASSKPASSV